MLYRCCTLCSTRDVNRYRYFHPYLGSLAPTQVKQDGQPLNMNFGQAFGVGPAYGNKLPPNSSTSSTQLAINTRPNYDEDIRLAPYHYGSPTQE